MDEFDRRARMLKALGVEFHTDYEYRGDPPDRECHDLKVFRSVKLPLLPAEWNALYMKEGASYVGGCCGSMSHLQDTICHQIRMDSGWFEIRTLAEIAEVMVEHDGDENNDNDSDLTFGHLPKGTSLKDQVSHLKKGLKDPRRGKKFGVDPWTVMMTLWHITKDFYSPEVPKAYGDRMTEVEKSVTILASGLQAISWEKLFDTHPAKEDRSQSKVNRSLLLYRMLPAWKTLADNLANLDLGDMEGWALIEKDKGPQAVCSNGHGYCVYDTRQKVDEVLALWRQDEAERQDGWGRDKRPIDERIGVRRVRVSAGKGLEFLD